MAIFELLWDKRNLKTNVPPLIIRPWVPYKSNWETTELFQVNFEQVWFSRFCRSLSENWLSSGIERNFSSQSLGRKKWHLVRLLQLIWFTFVLTYLIYNNTLIRQAVLARIRNNFQLLNFRALRFAKILVLDRISRRPKENPNVVLLEAIRVIKNAERAQRQSDHFD